MSASACMTASLFVSQTTTPADCSFCTAASYSCISVRVPQTAEALVLHYADNIDAKMAQCRGLFAQLGEGESWTPYQATLGRAMHRCAQTPVEEKVEKKPRASRKASGDDGMLSLL